MNEYTRKWWWGKEEGRESFCSVRPSPTECTGDVDEWKKGAVVRFFAFLDQVQDGDRERRRRRWTKPDIPEWMCVCSLGILGDVDLVSRSAVKSATRLTNWSQVPDQDEDWRTDRAANCETTVEPNWKDLQLVCSVCVSECVCCGTDGWNFWMLERVHFTKFI